MWANDDSDLRETRFPSLDAVRPSSFDYHTPHMNNGNSSNRSQQLLNWLMSEPLTTTGMPIDGVMSNEPVSRIDSLNYILNVPMFDSIPPAQLDALSPPPPQQQQPPQHQSYRVPTTTGSAFHPGTVQSVVTPSQGGGVYEEAPMANGTSVISSCSNDGRLNGGSISSGSGCDQPSRKDNGGAAAAPGSSGVSPCDQHEPLSAQSQYEKRKLRNKLSARKFRNRKKEYLSTIEGDLQQQKQENERLNLEISLIRATADKLQEENNELRLQLALCNERQKELKRQMERDRRSNSSNGNSRSPDSSTHDNGDVSQDARSPAADNDTSPDHTSSGASAPRNDPADQPGPTLPAAGIIVAAAATPVSYQPHRSTMLLPRRSSPSSTDQLAPTPALTVLGYVLIAAAQDLVCFAKSLAHRRPTLLSPKTSAQLTYDFLRQQRHLRNRLRFDILDSTRKTHGEKNQDRCIRRWHLRGPRNSGNRGMLSDEDDHLRWLQQQRQLCQSIYDHIVALDPELGPPRQTRPHTYSASTPRLVA